MKANRLLWFSANALGRFSQCPVRDSARFNSAPAWAKVVCTATSMSPIWAICAGV